MNSRVMRNGCKFLILRFLNNSKYHNSQSLINQLLFLWLLSNAPLISIQYIYKKLKQNINYRWLFSVITRNSRGKLYIGFLWAIINVAVPHINRRSMTCFLDIFFKNFVDSKFLSLLIWILVNDVGYRDLTLDLYIKLWIKLHCISNNYYTRITTTCSSRIKLIAIFYH